MKANETGMTFAKKFIKNYAFSLILVAAILAGSAAGIVFKARAAYIKPLGDIFLNLLFTIVAPMVFFSISSAIASMSDVKRLGRILLWMILIFVATGVVSSVIMAAAVKAYPPAQGMTLELASRASVEHVKVSDQIVRAVSVPEFGELLSKKNMLALIIFSILIGLGASTAGVKGEAFRKLLISGNEVMTRVMRYIMLYAPVGLGAYFAYLVGVFGPQLLGSYYRTMLLYYPVALGYFFVGFSCYAYFAGGLRSVKLFWSNILPASLTAWATGSSIATIPANLEAAEKSGVPADIREVVIPIGATIHMDGSCLAAIVKISLLFGLFNIDFSGFWTISTAIGVALLSGIVMSGIPGGGFLGELMIVTLYGFPLEALPIISMIGTLVDPPATMVNAIGDNVASMMVGRIMGPKS